MSVQSFTLTLAGPAIVENEAILDQLFQAGCSDASFAERDGRTFADFDRDRDTLGEALVSAIEQIESVRPLKVTRVEEQDLVTITDIAGRTGRSRQNIWQLARGERGSGDFPMPVAQIGEDRSLWRWSDVAEWLTRRGFELGDAAQRAHLIGAVNAYLDARDHIDHLADATERYIIGQLTMKRASVLIQRDHVSIDHSLDTKVLFETCTVASTTAVALDRPKQTVVRTKGGPAGYACAA
jgi:predicted DNA-binding transcriptional regulator AlpA